MATLDEVNTQLLTLLKNALNSSGVVNFIAGSEWPSAQEIDDAGNGAGPAIIAIIHRMTNYQVKNMRFRHSTTTNSIGISSTLSDFSMTSGQSVELTVGYANGSDTVNINDMISFSLVNGNGNINASYTAVAGDSLNSIAANLGTAIAAQMPTMGVSVSGTVITITNNDTTGYHCSSNVGQATTIKTTVNWAMRSMQFNAWTGDLPTKYSVKSAIENLLATLADAEGFFLDSGEWVYLKMNMDKPDDAETDKDVFCDVYLFTIQNNVDITTEQWAVLATNPQYSTQ